MAAGECLCIVVLRAVCAPLCVHCVLLCPCAPRAPPPLAFLSPPSVPPSTPPITHSYNERRGGGGGGSYNDGGRREYRGPSDYHNAETFGAE